MAGIIIFNGTFGSGKTDLAQETIKSISDSNSRLPIYQVADGPHLVKQISEVAHGQSGMVYSSNHIHDWTRKKHHHGGLEDKTNFPFTVKKRSVVDNMFKGFLFELFQLSKMDGLVIAELGTGVVSDTVVGDPDFSTKRFFEIAKKYPLFHPCWKELKEKIIKIVIMDTEWGTRIERNRNRNQIADGLNASWLLQEAAMNLTRYSDSDHFLRNLPHEKVTNFDNNSSDNNTEKEKFIRELLLPKINRSIENSQRNKSVEY